MGNTAIEQKNNKYVVVNRLVYPETINERELDIIIGRKVGGLLPVTTETSKKSVMVKSTFENMTPLKSYFSGNVSKKMFLDIIIQLVAIVKECEKNLMNVNNLMLDWEYIFLTSRTKTLQCLFWPIFNNQNAVDLAGFFKELLLRVVFSDQEDHDYLQYFNSQSVFSINSFEAIIFDLMGKTVENKTQLQVVPPSKQEKIILCSKCGNVCSETAKFCVFCGSPVNILGNTTVNNNNNQIPYQNFDQSKVEKLAETIVLNDDEVESAQPYLIRARTQETIFVNKPTFRIGKDRKTCNYCVLDNNAVSRNHADIIIREGRYFIIDNRSTNSTFINGRVIPTQKEIEIFPGTKLTLANEDFNFYK